MTLKNRQQKNLSDNNGHRLIYGKSNFCFCFFENNKLVGPMKLTRSKWTAIANERMNERAYKQYN